MASRGRKPSRDLSHVACPNPACPAFGQAGHPSLVANGTYPTQSGRGQRFKCKTCGQSFCRRSGTIFYDRHEPEAKVLSALKVLSKGMSIRRVAEILEVKPDTIRRWLVAAADRSKLVDQQLLREKGVSRAELKALWTSVKRKALRQRGVLWRKRSGWWQRTSGLSA